MPRDAGIRWEYAAMVYDEDADRWTVNGDPGFIPEPVMVAALNAMGARGWEMCAYEPYAKYPTATGESQSRPMSFYFKRAIRPVR